MTQPLALVFYEKLLPGTQLSNRLQDLGYRVTPVGDVDSLLKQAAESHPMLVIADLLAKKSQVALTIKALRENPATRHLPIIGYCGDKEDRLKKEALSAGANFVVDESVLLNHLPQFLEQALHID